MSGTLKATHVVVAIEVKYGNPNGDPNRGNRPRQDPQTGHGLVTAVCLKRKINETLEKVYKQKLFGYDGGARARTVNTFFADAKNNGADMAKSLGDNFYNARAHGGVFSIGDAKKALGANLRGVVVVDEAISVDPISPMEEGIVPSFVISEKDAEAGKNNTMGSRWLVPYGLYLTTIRLDAAAANTAGQFTRQDWDVYLNAVENMFECDMSAARPNMSVRGMWIFEAPGEYMSKPHRIQNAVKFTRKSTVVHARRFEDYTLEVICPEGLALSTRG